MAHTPGTWTVKTPGGWKPGSALPEFHIQDHQTGAVVTTVRGIHGTNYEYDRAHAVARLIAAAPELLEAAKDAARYWSGFESCPTCGAEPVRDKHGNWDPDASVGVHDEECHVSILVRALAKAEGRDTQ